MSKAFAVPMRTKCLLYITGALVFLLLITTAALRYVPL
jgi:hypothetical protein